MDNMVINIKQLTKEYKLYDSEMDRFKESFNPFKKDYHKSFYALKDVNIQICKGEKVGIIGANGAGKSTLLKIVTGVLEQTEGSVDITGRVAALLELGAGFNKDYTGLENIRLNGMLMGYSVDEMEEKIGKIIDFADIGDFINQPVKTYSSGMFVRLAFATQIFSDPDILIVDEALSVGDIRFQQKCYRAMDSLMKDKTVVLVTHDTAAVTRFCERVIWINHGEKVFDGEVTEGLKKYQEFLINQAIIEKSKEVSNDYDYEANVSAKTTEKSNAIYVPEIQVKDFKGNGQAKIYQCGLFNEKNETIENVEPNTNIKCIIRVEYNIEAKHPIIGLAIRDRLGNEVIGINSQTINVELPPARGKKEYQFNFKLPELNHGEYTVTIAIANGYQEDHVQMCWVDDALTFKVLKRLHDIPGWIYIENGDIEIFDI